MKNVNEIGKKYEKKCAKLLKEKGYWCHIFARTDNGQPCDIVALKNNENILIDVKHCVGNIFNLSRVEPNQIETFQYAYCLGIKKIGFAIWSDVENKFKWLKFEDIDFNKKSYKLNLLKDFEDFLK